MRERRSNTRRKTLLGGRIVYNHRQSTMDCVLRNMGSEGAKLVFSNLALIPDEFDVQVSRMQRTFRARVVWRHKDELGVSFVSEKSDSKIIPFDYAVRIRALEADKLRLQERVAQLSAAD